MNATDLDTFSQGVLIGIYQNTLVFATPVIAEVDLQTIYNDYVTAYVAYEQYGLTKKTAYLNAKSSLIDALNTLVVYVDSIAMGDVSTIALSGFIPSREVDEPSQPLGKISNFTVNLLMVLLWITAELLFRRVQERLWWILTNPVKN
mgnify:CR=1 FL=1